MPDLAIAGAIAGTLIGWLPRATTNRGDLRKWSLIA